MASHSSSFKAILPAHGSHDDLSEASTTMSGNTPSGTDPNDIGREEKKPKRKRNVQGKVATIACLECRKTRSRCDGEPPNTCVRCRTRGFRCVYQPHTKIQKDEILNELEQQTQRAESLSQRNHDLSVILQVVSSNGHLQEIVSRLRRKEDAKTIAEWLMSIPSLQLLLEQSSDGPTDLRQAVESISRQYQVGSHTAREDASVRSRWTVVTKDVAFLDFLVQQYLEYIHPNCMLFNETSFVDSYRAGPEAGLACSAALLNAMCAMACNTLDRDYLDSENTAANLAHLHQAFLTQARTSISLAEAQNLTTVQAMAVIYLADASHGKVRMATTYLKCASESLRSLEPEVELNADFDLSRWGLHYLDTLSSSFTYQNPFTPQTVNPNISFESSRDLLEQYTGDPDDLLPQRSFDTSKMIIELAGYKARLCKLVHSMGGIYGGSHGRVTPEAILILHQQFLDLFDSLPQSLRRPENSGVHLDVRAFHIEYHSMVSTLWTPLISFAQAHQDEEMLSNCREYMLTNARKAATLVHVSLQAASSRVDSRRDRSCELLLPQHIFCIVNICDSLARWTVDTSERSAAIHTCLRCLNQNTLNFKLCGLLKKLFITELEKMPGVEPDMIEQLKTEYQIHGIASVEEALDATTRLTYLTPFPSMIKWLDGDFQQQWTQAWSSLEGSGSRMRATPSGNQGMRVIDMLNDS